MLLKISRSQDAQPSSNMEPCLAIFLHFESFDLVVPHRQLIVPLKGQTQEFSVDLAFGRWGDAGTIGI